MALGRAHPSARVPQLANLVRRPVAVQEDRHLADAGDGRGPVAERGSADVREGEPAEVAARRTGCWQARRVCSPSHQPAAASSPPWGSQYGAPSVPSQ